VVQPDLHILLDSCRLLVAAVLVEAVVTVFAVYWEEVGCIRNPHTEGRVAVEDVVVVVAETTIEHRHDGKSSHQRS